LSIAKSLESKALLAKELEGNARDDLRFAWINGFESLNHFVAKLLQFQIRESKDRCFDDRELPQWYGI
jgi:hypothetical protein